MCSQPAFAVSPNVPSLTPALANPTTLTSLSSFSSSSFTPRSISFLRARRAASLRHPAPVFTPPCMTSFRKYHGLGNDFVLIDNRHDVAPVLTASESVSVCDRHTGVGADGVIFLLPATESTSDMTMRLYNSDGSEPEMCGNGIRCLARFASDLGVPSVDVGNKYTVDTLAGPIICELQSSGDVKVDMGPPITSPSEAIPTTLAVPTGTLQNVAGRDWTFSCVSMGNPHAITFVDDQKLYHHLDKNLETIGPDFELHPVFPQRTNTEFIRMISPTECDMLVWERGAGRTRACGTGACAVVVAAVNTKRAEKDTPVTVHLPGGDLIIEWSSATNHVLMTGPAELVFEGQLAKSESRHKSPALA